MCLPTRLFCGNTALAPWRHIPLTIYIIFYSIRNDLLFFMIMIMVIIIIIILTILSFDCTDIYYKFSYLNNIRRKQKQSVYLTYLT